MLLGLSLLIALKSEGNNNLIAYSLLASSFASEMAVNTGWKNSVTTFAQNISLEVVATLSFHKFTFVLLDAFDKRIETIWQAIQKSNGSFDTCLVFLPDFVIVTNTPTADSDGARMMGLRVQNLRSWEWHKSMKTEMKNETRWNGTRILDWYVNDWRWIPWKGSRRLQVFIQVLRFSISRIYLTNISRIYPSRIHHRIFLEYTKGSRIF